MPRGQAAVDQARAGFAREAIGAKRLLELAHPDVAEADRRARITVRLQLDRRRVVLPVDRLPDVERLPLQLEAVLHQYAVVEGGDPGRRLDRTVGVEGRRRPDHVVHLPFAWLAAGVDERDALLVNARRLAVDVGLVLVRVEDLQLVSAVARRGGGEEHAAVAARLAGAGDALG